MSEESCCVLGVASESRDRVTGEFSSFGATRNYGRGNELLDCRARARAKTRKICDGLGRPSTMYEGRTPKGESSCTRVRSLSLWRIEVLNSNGPYSYREIDVSGNFYRSTVSTGNHEGDGTKGESRARIIDVIIVKKQKKRDGEKERQKGRERDGEEKETKVKERRKRETHRSRLLPADRGSTGRARCRACIMKNPRPANGMRQGGGDNFPAVK